ncbi:hypothetical protein D3C81_1855150 [compost metagenome]
MVCARRNRHHAAKPCRRSRLPRIIISPAYDGPVGFQRQGVTVSRRYRYDIAKICRNIGLSGAVIPPGDYAPVRLYSESVSRARCDSDQIS